MPISHAKKLIFIHIPKNAGESVERSLGIYGQDRKPTLLQRIRGKKPGPAQDANDHLWGVLDRRVVLHHLTAQDLKAFIGDDRIWQDYCKFAVVRNPWSKAASEYSWFLRYAPKLSFREWADTLETRIQINHAISLQEVGHNRLQCDFVLDASGSMMVDHILRFESLGEEFAALSQAQGWNVVLMHAKTTASASKTDFRTLYDTATIEIIERIYRADLARFGYDKDDTFGGA